VAASRPRVLNSVGAVVAVCSVAQQGRGWPNSDGDGAPAGLTSLFDPAESREEGSRVRPTPLRGRGALAVQEWVAQRREAAPASSHSPPQWWGWAPPRELAEQRRGVIPRRAVARSCCVRALNARTHVREQVRAGRTLRRRAPLEGGVSPRARWTPLEGGVSPEARRTPLEEALCCAALVGRGVTAVWVVLRVFCVRLEVGFAFCVFCRFKAGFPPVF
jgi:hypothetical protein